MVLLFLIFLILKVAKTSLIHKEGMDDAEMNFEN